MTKENDHGAASVLKTRKKNILLVRYFNKLHFVNLDHRMHRKVKAWFLDAPRTEEEMDEKGLVRTSIPLKAIRGVAAAGTGRGMVVQFYLADRKVRYELDKDCDLADFSALFHGLESFAPPQKKSNWQDDRLAKQDPKFRRILWAWGCMLNVISFAAGFYIWVEGYEPAWVCVAALLCIPATFILYALFPDYFTLFAERRKYGRKKAVLGLHGATICPACMILGAVYNYGFFSCWKAWMIGAAAVAGLAVALFVTAPVYRNRDILVPVVLVGLLLSGGPVLALNDLLDSAPVQEIHTEVLDKDSHHSTKGGDYYELIVMLDGKKAEIPVGGETYRNTEIGEIITAEYHEGAFGIPFAKISE